MGSAPAKGIACLTRGFAEVLQPPGSETIAQFGVDPGPGLLDRRHEGRAGRAQSDKRQTPVRHPVVFDKPITPKPIDHHRHRGTRYAEGACKACL
jgi:hypothetical protein